MKNSLSRKLFFAVFGIAVLVALAMGAADGWNFARGFVGYINGQTEERMRQVLPRLGDYYREQHSWDGLLKDRRRWFGLIHPQGEPENEDQSTWELPVSDLTGAIFRISLLDADKRSLIAFVEPTEDALHMPIEVDGKTVGWLAMTPFQSVTEAGGELLLKRQLQASLAVGLLALLLAALLAGWASRRLLAPVRRVAAATHRLAAGEYSERVEEAANDDVGQLARDFNLLAYTLERNERMRRDFMADVSHELRTPLAVLQGELEALEDGVRKLDGDSLRSLQQEVRQLNKLVDDLSELSLADVGALTYRLQPYNLVELLREALAGSQERCREHGLQLELQLPLHALPVRVDAARIRQLISNLLENSLRYTEAGGLLRIRLQEQQGRIALDWMDSAPGVAEADIPHLCERFFRTDSSRQRASGGSGLGLAICRSIAEAHGGTLEAKASPLGGLWLHLNLPWENGPC
nr:ATP-binding protein [Pseudomonas oleovorans]